MNDNSMIITAMCSHIGADENIQPFEPREWNVLAKELATKNLEPKALAGFSAEELKEAVETDHMGAERILRLLDRGGNLTFALNKLGNAGIYVVTRADDMYPKRIKEALGNSCPPLFYYAGELGLLDHPAVGYAGSRSVTDKDTEFTVKTARKTVDHGYCIVSGGAKGVDSTAENAAVDAGSFAISFLADSMLRKIKIPGNLKMIQEGKLVILSAVNPDAGFHPGTAMMRNRYIYAHSRGTVVVRSDYNKGGTWSGATENLRHKWSPTLCWNNTRYQGNRALIEQGAIPIDESWNGDLKPLTEAWNESQPEQLSLFS